MEEIFIKNIHINKVRHLENIDIPISETERKHLILTGKNGSGKTSVLLEIKNWLEGVENKSLLELTILEESIFKLRQSLYELQRAISLGKNDIDVQRKIISYKNDIQNKQAQIDFFNSINIDFSSVNIFTSFNDGNFILLNFEAKRKLEFQIPKGIKKISFKEKYGVNEIAGKDFLQHIVNLRADRLFAFDEDDDKLAYEIGLWFDKFENSLKDIFEDENIILEFNRKTYSFSIINKNNEFSDFTTLSDGYSAIFNIISELIMRMENKASKSYDIQGIVLIDEIETHLHIDLQKKILPFLTNFFPKIQFIVTTHSPFVLNSVDNAVIFDLEKKVLVEDMTGYSINSIVESYFDSDNYSAIVKNKVSEYENLLNKHDLTEDEEEKLFDLKRYFRDLPKMFSPELALKINQLELANLSVK
jgi:energy-coupling factor transporter ATP-binding protein EcfA2